MIIDVDIRKRTSAHQATPIVKNLNILFQRHFGSSYKLRDLDVFFCQSSRYLSGRSPEAMISESGAEQKIIMAARIYLGVEADF